MEKVEKLLSKKDMSAADLTRLTGIPSGRLSKLGKGEGKLRMKEALKVARALNVPLEFLADDEMHEPPRQPEASEEMRALLVIVLELGPKEVLARVLRPTTSATDSTSPGYGKHLGQRDMNEHHARLEAERDRKAIEMNKQETKS